MPSSGEPVIYIGILLLALALPQTEYLCFQICMLKLNPQRDGLWKVIRSGGQSPHEWDQCSWTKHSRELPCPFYHVKAR